MSYLDANDVATSNDLWGYVSLYLDLPKTMRTFSVDYAASESFTCIVDGIRHPIDIMDGEKFLMDLCESFGVDWRPIRRFRLTLNAGEPISLFEMAVYPILKR